MWQKMRRAREFTCTKCHAVVRYEEFDEGEDMCLFCIFPETSGSRPVEFEYTKGIPKNTTEERYVMDNLTNIPINPRNEPLTTKDKSLLYKLKPKAIKKRKVYK